MFRLMPLTTSSGRPLHYGNAYLTHDAARLQQRTPCLEPAEPPIDWAEVEHGLRIAVAAVAAVA
jgi:hypothetical protein